MAIGYLPWGRAGRGAGTYWTVPEDEDEVDVEDEPPVNVSLLGIPGLEEDEVLRLYVSLPAVSRSEVTTPTSCPLSRCPTCDEKKEYINTLWK